MAQQADQFNSSKAAAEAQAAGARQGRSKLRAAATAVVGLAELGALGALVAGCATDANTRRIVVCPLPSSSSSGSVDNQLQTQRVSVGKNGSTVETVFVQATPTTESTPSPVASPTECAGVVVTPDNNEHAVTYENPNFFNDIDKALNMTPKQLAALQIKLAPTKTSHSATPEDVLSGTDSDINKYRGMIVTASVMHDSFIENGQSKTVDKGVIALLFEVNGEPMIGYYVADLSKLTRLGIAIEPYKATAFDLQTSSGNTSYWLKTPTSTVIESISKQSFDPNNLVTPSYDKDGLFNLNLRAGEIVDITSMDKQLTTYLDSVGGPTGIKTKDLKGIYEAQKAQLTGSEVMPPFSFKGATFQDVTKALVMTHETDNKNWRITSLRDAVTNGESVYNALSSSNGSATINGEKTTIQDDFSLLKPNSD